MNDTSPEIQQMIRARLMARSGSERFLMGSQMFDAARQMMLAALPGGATELEKRSFLLERTYGLKVEDLVRAKRETATIRVENFE